MDQKGVISEWTLEYFTPNNVLGERFRRLLLLLYDAPLLALICRYKSLQNMPQNIK